MLPAVSHVSLTISRSDAESNVIFKLPRRNLKFVIHIFRPSRTVMASTRDKDAEQLLLDCDNGKGAFGGFAWTGATLSLLSRSLLRERIERPPKMREIGLVNDLALLGESGIFSFLRHRPVLGAFVYVLRATKWKDIKAFSLTNEVLDSALVN